MFWPKTLIIFQTVLNIAQTYLLSYHYGCNICSRQPLQTGPICRFLILPNDGTNHFYPQNKHIICFPKSNGKMNNLYSSQQNQYTMNVVGAHRCAGLPDSGPQLPIADSLLGQASFPCPITIYGSIFFWATRQYFKSPVVYVLNPVSDRPTVFLKLACPIIDIPRAQKLPMGVAA